MLGRTGTVLWKDTNPVPLLPPSPTGPAELFSGGTHFRNQFGPSAGRRQNPRGGLDSCALAKWLLHRQLGPLGSTTGRRRRAGWHHAPAGWAPSSSADRPAHAGGFFSETKLLHPTNAEVAFPLFET